jgi:hypothetical protein
MQKPGITSTTNLDVLSSLDIVKEKAVFDGLGRPIQTISYSASPLGKDIIQSTAYDEYGRVINEYLPYVAQESNGRYRYDALFDPDNSDTDPLLKYQSGIQYQFYQNTSDIKHDAVPYSEKVLEASPLNRIKEQYGPGENWKVNQKRIQFSNEVNTPEDAVLNWQLAVGDKWPSSSSGNFAEGLLYKNITIDEEDNNQVIEFVDKLQRTILKRVQAVDEPSATYVASEWADTYYIYDDLGNLRFVLPPEAVAHLSEFGN